jgi:hypothetical protein
MRKALLIVAALAFGAGGCTVTEERAGAGAAIGAGTGALLGAITTNKPGGALAGAALGGATGAIIGAATTPAPAHGRPVSPVVVERVRERQVYVEEEVELAPVCRTRVDEFTDAFGNVEVRRRRVCR